MARLLVHVEGQTEETFVNEILCEHLFATGYHSISARIVGNARLRNRRGGVRAWPAVKQDILKHLREDQTCIATTMIDYYGMPATGPRAWPGREQANSKQSVSEKALYVEDALRDDLLAEMGDLFALSRFVPFVLMHEFEGLLFSDCAAFSRGIGRSDIGAEFQAIRNQFVTPEDINDSPDTAPSKRIKNLLPNYEKPLFGVIGILEIGLVRIRQECPHFDAWLSELESRVDGR